MEDINIRFIKTIEAIGVSSYKLAKELNTSEAVLSNIKNGKNKPSIDIIEKLLNNYKVINPVYLLIGDGEILLGKNVHLDVNHNVHLYPNVHTKSVQKDKQDGVFEPEIKYEGNFTFNIEEIINRLKELTGSQSDVELADVFNVKSGTVSAWRKRNTINYEEVIRLSYLNKWDLNYVLLGKSISHRANTIINPRISVSGASNLKHIAELTKKVYDSEMTIASLEGQLELMKGLLDTYIKSR